jgi:acetyltransferase-like isoleucine patch superfamily enzyme
LRAPTAPQLVELVRGARLRGRLDLCGFVLAGRRVSIVKRHGTIRFGGHVSLGDDTGIAVVGRSDDDRAVLTIGHGTYLQPRVHVNCQTSVRIGEQCSISWDVEILDSDFHHILTAEEQPHVARAPIVLEDRVWVGVRAIILKGVTIGHDSIVGAGAVVTRSVPPFSLCAGNPARVVRTVEGWRP